MGSPCWIGSCQGLWTHWGRSPDWSCFSWRATPYGKALQCTRWSLRSPLPAETNYDELTTALIPHLSALLQGKEGEKIRTEIMPGKKGGLAARHWKICCYFSLTFLDLIGKKLIFPKSILFCPWWQLLRDVSLSLLWVCHYISYIFYIAPIPHT